MLLSVVVAAARDGVIGRDGTLPWHLPADLQRFRAITLGKPIVMGRHTHDSIGRVLPGRHNVVLSRAAAYRAPGCDVFPSLAAAMAALVEVPEVMIIGGAQLYAEALPKADRLYLTEVAATLAGDVYFPAWCSADWRETATEAHGADAEHAFAYCFRVFERINRTSPPLST